MDAIVQLHSQRLETLLVQQGRQILKQPFGACPAAMKWAGALDKMPFTWY
jgi:hypothetical protein